MMILMVLRKFFFWSDFYGIGVWEEDTGVGLIHLDGERLWMVD